MAGTVYLVGAGPGDPGLLSTRARELIAAADVILYDRLIGAEALDGARADAELLYVGKEGGGESVPQEQTEQLMLDRARAGLTVVRLKGGDPFVFGRGGEEALALREAGVAYEVVPGVTAGIAAGAYAGIPVTHRGLAAAVAFVTGHSREDGNSPDPPDYRALAAFPGTLVFYMGVSRLAEIARQLIAAGRDAAQPAAVVQEGTLPGQRTVTATLETLADAAAAAGVRAPAVTIVGPVAALADRLAWRSPGPLSGLSVTVTRARAQASTLAAKLSAAGARVVQAPALVTRPLAGPALDPSRFDLVCVTSVNGVAGLFERLAAGGRDARSLAGARVAAIGPGTAAALAERGIVADVVPERAVAESLAEALADPPVTRALIVRAREGRDVLARALREQGADVEELAVYETLAAALSGPVLQAAREADYVTFASGSSVRFFLDALAAAGASGPPFGAGTRVVSIGPVTSEALRERGLEVDVEADRHDIDGLLEAICADAALATGDAPAGAGEP
jgi:uroporphyrinogen III methyltransferase/synthase